MHEMSIALSILEIVKNEAQKAKSQKVTEIVMDIGSLSGVEVEALKFAMKACLTEDIVANCKVKIHTIAAYSACNECFKEFECKNLFSVCPHCGSYSSKLIKGQEMQVKSIVVD